MKEAHYCRWRLCVSLGSGKATLRARFDAEAFDVELHGGVPVIVCQGVRAAIVTGTPNSFGRLPLRILGREHRLPVEILGVTAESIGQHLGTTIDAVIGGDLLREFECLIDLVRGKVVFSHGSLGCDGVAARHCRQTSSARSGSGPERGVSRHWRALVIRTPLRSARTAVAAKDFFPLVGEFETFTKAEIELAAFSSARFGLLPRCSSPWPLSVGDRVGALRQCPVLLDLQHHRIMLVQHEPSFVASLRGFSTGRPLEGGRWLFDASASAITIVDIRSGANDSRPATWDGHPKVPASSRRRAHARS